MLRSLRPDEERAMKIQRLTAHAIAAVGLIVLSSGLFAADPMPVHWSATASTSVLPVAKGAKVVAKITATIAPGWHLYAFEQQPGGPMPTVLSLVAGQPFATDGKILESDPKMEYDTNFNLPISLFEDKAVFTLPAKAVGAVHGNPATVKIDVAFQTCNDRMCLPLTVVHLSAPIAARKAN
jgi:Disulphide bond corrector protein DsbC